jgi:16S rRNA G966 N2-methylase RsmD
MAWMGRSPPQQFDLILLDPPFDSGLFEPAWHAAMPLLRSGGWLYLEAPAQWALEAPGLTLHRHLKAGAVHAHLWKCVDENAT